MKTSIHLVRAGLAAAILSLPQIASAASATWTGAGTTGDFSDGANWNTGTAPGNTTGAFISDTATFNNSTNTNVLVDTRGIAGLIFDTGAGAYVFENGTFLTQSITLNAGVTKSQTFFSTLSSWASNPNLTLTNNSSTLGVIFNLRGTLLSGPTNGGAVNLGRGTGSGAIVWGNINDNASKPTSLALLDSNTSMVMLRGNGSNFSGPVSVTRGAAFFNSISNVGGGASSFGAPTTAANGTISLTGGGRPVYLFYTGSGSTTDRAINNTSGALSAGTGLDLSNVGTGALVWNGNFTNSTSLVATLSLGGFNTSENRYGGVIADGASTTTSLAKYGQGVWNISGANTYTGGTTVGEGLLRADFAVAGAPSSDIISSSNALTMSGGTFAVRGATTGTSAQTVNGLTLNRGSSTVAADGNGGGGTTLNLNAINRSQGATLDVVTSGGGVVSTSTALMNNGVLASAASGGVAYATANGSDWATISGGNIVALTSYQTSTDPANWASTDNVSLSGNPSAEIGTQTINTLKVDGAANVSIQSSKTLTLGAGGLLFTGSGSQSISGGSITSGTSSKELVVHQNNTGSSVDIASAITGANLVLTKSGAGTLSLSGTNTYTGTAVIAEGVLKGGFGTTIPTSSFVILSGGVLGLTSDLTATVGTSGGSGSRVGWTNSGGFAAYGGNRTVNLNSGAALSWVTGSASSFLVGGQALMLGATDADATVIWTNAIVLNPANSLHAVMREIRVADGSAAADAEVSGVLSGAHAGLTKTGTGALRLTAANTYDGATIISAGTLIVNGSINNSMLTMVYSGATLAGTGSSAQIELMAGGAMRPGDGGIGTFSTTQNGNSDFNWHGEASGAFAQMKFELSNTNASSDKIDLGAGMLSKADGVIFKFDFLGTGMANQTYTLISFGSSLNFSVSDFSYTGLASGLTGEFSLTDNALTFTTAAVPEPSTFAMIIAGLVAVVVIRRRGVQRVA